MHQLTQQLKSGKMEILEVPFPALDKGQLLVRNYYSVISAGTEGKTVSDARKGYVAKAKTRQKEVKQVIEMVKTNGLLPTYKLVMNKLEAPASLGYSTAGEVIAIGGGVTKFEVGDFVACGGQGAFHADVVSVYENLCVKVSNDIDFKQASFSTIASIAIQGIRQADLRFGENCVIIGMGLIGQLTYKILEASAIYPIGIDISDEQLQIAKNAGITNVYNRNHEGLEELIRKHTNGAGSDAVIITAGTSSNDPVEFAGTVARQKGKVVIVGAVPTGFSRANYYKKELDLKMSCSYGPGRYDAAYEEKGRDYPIGYVRWTENRNMQSFIDLIASKKIDISKLITHSFKLENAKDAYDMIHSKSEAFGGILLQYNTQKELKQYVQLNTNQFNPQEPNVGFIGAGSFAQGTLLPNMKGLCNFVGVSTAKGNTARYVGDKYGFSYCAETADAIINDDKINTIFITTRHNLHAEFIIKAMKKNKNVFVEKPMAMNEKELSEIKAVYEESIEQEKPVSFMVGFNRRFSPAIQTIKEMFNDEQAKAINIRINAGQMPPDHWVNDTEIGGGRIIGEACHFIDLAMYLACDKIVSVSADSMKDPDGLNNSVVISLQFNNGSVACVNYFSNGSKTLPKEQIEVFCGGTVVQINDFKEMVVYGNKVKRKKFKGQDKGHANEVKLFLKNIREGKPAPITFDECYLSTLATLKVLESIKEKRKIAI